MDKDKLISFIESSLVSVASSVPVASSIATGWNEYKNHVQQENIKNILDNFLVRINEIESKVNKSYLESNELKALIVKTCFMGKEELIEEKRKYLGLFLANSCLDEKYQDSSKEAVLETLIKLNPFDITIMLSMNYNDDPNMDNWTWMDENTLLEKFGESSKENTKASFWYLLSLGVIQDMSSTLTLSTIWDYIKSVKLYSRMVKLQDRYDKGHRYMINEPQETNDRNEILNEIHKIENQLKSSKGNENNSGGYTLTQLGKKVLEFIGKSEMICK